MYARSAGGAVVSRPLTDIPHDDGGVHHTAHAQARELLTKLQLHLRRRVPRARGQGSDGGRYHAEELAAHLCKVERVAKEVMRSVHLKATHDSNVACLRACGYRQTRATSLCALGMPLTRHSSRKSLCVLAHADAGPEPHSVCAA